MPAHLAFYSNRCRRPHDISLFGLTAACSFDMQMFSHSKTAPRRKPHCAVSFNKTASKSKIQQHVSNKSQPGKSEIASCDFISVRSGYDTTAPKRDAFLRSVLHTLRWTSLEKTSKRYTSKYQSLASKSSQKKQAGKRYTSKSAAHTTSKSRYFNNYFASSMASSLPQ